MRARRVSTSSGAMWQRVTVQPQAACRRAMLNSISTSATARVARLLADKATYCKPAERPRQRRRRARVRVLRLHQLLHLHQLLRRLLHLLRQPGRRLRRAEGPRQGLVPLRRLGREVLINTGLSDRNLNGNSRANLASSQRLQSNCAAGTVVHRKRFATSSRRLEGRRILGRADSATCSPFNPLPYPAVAFPLNLRHLACNNVDFEGSKAADAGFPSFQRDFVVTGR